MLGKVSCKDFGYVHHSLYMLHSSTDFTVIFFGSSGARVPDRLPSDETGFLRQGNMDPVVGIVVYDEKVQ